MRFIWKMPRMLRLYYEQELKLYQAYEQKQQLVNAWHHLERAHILGQPYPIEHSAVHGKMLAFGIKTRNVKEVVGQLPRLLVGGIKSWAGTIPVGNTGGANVVAWKPMPIPKDLQEIIQQANSKI